MTKGSYIWDVTIEFSYSPLDLEIDKLVVSAPSFEKACKKAVGIFEAHHKPWYDKESNTPNVLIVVEEFEITEVTRGAWIDG